MSTGARRPAGVRPCFPLTVPLLLALAACGVEESSTRSEGGERGPAAPAGAETDQQVEPPEGAEAISLLGNPLHPPELPPEVRDAYERNLEDAREDLAAAPEDPDALIWVGRRLGYLGKYREAIDTFTRGVELHPDDPRMLRHRGHRYITVRELDRAKDDLQRAAELIEGNEDRVEPDGLPNERGIPTSTLHFNVWYHLALAHYLQDELEPALLAWNEARRAARHPDAVVAATYWLNHTLRRLGLEERADALLAEEIREDMDIIESGSYMDILLLWKGERTPEEIAGAGSGEDALANVTTAYGLGRWHALQGRQEEAERIWRGIVEGEGPWGAFGRLAAEAALARRGGDDR